MSKNKKKSPKKSEKKKGKTEEIQKQPNIADFIVRTKIPVYPTQQAIDGITFDFNDGLRIRTTDEKSDKKWKIVVVDEHTGSTLYNSTLGTQMIYRYPKRYYNEFSIYIFRVSEDGSISDTPDFVHHFDISKKRVLMFVAIRDALTTGLGDIIAWCSAIDEFQKKHDCQVDIVVQETYGIIPWIEEKHPNLHFINFDTYLDNYDYYASYYPLVYLNKDDNGNAPIYFKNLGLHEYPRYLLGLNNEPQKSHLELATTDERLIKEKYVCIATKSTGLLKTWYNPYGWREVIKFLKEQGYRVLCIDKNPEEEYEGIFSPFPEGAENFCNSGMKNIINYLTYCDFFIGLSSGLSWLAWTCSKPVVLISGFTLPFNEFFTPYRIINFDVCNSCWNDETLPWPQSYRRFCPKHNGTPNEFICTRAITPRMVINAIMRIPNFQAK